MVFINSGEASSAIQSTLSTEETLFELLMWLRQEMRKRAQEKAKQSEAESSEETPEVEPEPEPEPEADFSSEQYMDGLAQTVMAQTAVNLVQNYGQNDRYQAEGYSIKGQTIEGKEIYTVRDRSSEVVAEFEKLGDQFIFAQDGLPTPAQCQEFAKASQSLKVLQEQGEDVNQNAKTQLQALGDLAPAGTKAVVVATTILDRTGLDSYSGSLAEGQSGRYALSRDAEGALRIEDKIDGFDILMAHDGKIQSAMSSENIEHFTQLYERLDLQQNLNQQPRLTDVAASPVSNEVLEQQEAQILQAKPEYAPLIETLQHTAQDSSTLPKFCQELEKQGIHAEVTLKDGELEGIAYQYNNQWIPAHELGDRYTLGGLQHYLGVDAQSERDIPVLYQQNQVYRDITEPAVVSSTVSSAAEQTIEMPANSAAIDPQPQDATVAPEPEVLPLDSNLEIEEPDVLPLDPDRARTSDQQSARIVNVEHLGELEQRFQQNDSPSIEEFTEWLVAAQTLGKGSDDINRIKAIVRDATAGDSRKPSQIYKEQPEWSNLDYAMPAVDRQQMQADLTLFRELKREMGEGGVSRLSEMQRVSDEPFRIDEVEDFEQVREILNANGKSGVTEIHNSAGGGARPTDFNADSKTSSRAKDHER